MFTGGQQSDLHPTDGQNIWPDLNGHQKAEKSTRSILHNIDRGNEAIRIGKWKYIRGRNQK